MAIAEALAMTRRCFFAAAGMAVAATGASAAPEASVDSADLPKAVLLNDGDAKVYLLVFHTGQEVMKGLLAFANKHRLVGGYLTGIGAISHAVVGYFDPRKNAYLRIEEEEQLEVLSLTGNLTLNNDEPFFHVHAAFGRWDGSTRGGHVFEATVRPTVELVLTASPKPIRRKIDAQTGLPLIAS